MSCLLQEGVKTENDHINLKVAGQDGSVVQFKIKRHTPLSKLMKAYCERQVGLCRHPVSRLFRAPLSWKCACVSAHVCVGMHVCAHLCVSSLLGGLFSSALFISRWCPSGQAKRCLFLWGWSVTTCLLLGQCVCGFLPARWQNSEFECSSLASSHRSWKMLWRHLPPPSLISTKRLIDSFPLPFFKVTS